MDPNILAQYIKKLETRDSARNAAEISPEDEEEDHKLHKYWVTQPVPALDEPCDPEQFPEGQIDEVKQVSDIPEKSLSLPKGFVWSTVDITDDSQLSELYDLLYKNYVEDDDNMFRFDYSKDFLKWALTPPGWKAQWHCGVRNEKKGNLLAFISAIPATLRCKEEKVEMVEINFLCVHKKLRQKRVAPTLISEITRRVNREDIWQAAYTAGAVIPRPISSCQYWHRSLNPTKLIEIHFSGLKKNEKMKDVVKKYKVPKEPVHPLVPFETHHVPSAYKLVTEYLKKFQFAPLFTEDEFAHWLLPRDGVINAFVLANGSNVTDICSFYTLPSKVLHTKKYDMLRAAYSFYNVATTMTLPELINDALVMAKNLDFDVFNALHLMENESFLKECKFGAGDGNLQYYLYNWRLYPVEPNDIGLVLL
eukprot:m.64901 g.64901  ORF g.64901 m.64901 type:complete len:421 (+) comp8130_c0_seq1:181-1443(+)